LARESGAAARKPSISGEGGMRVYGFEMVCAGFATTPLTQLRLSGDDLAASKMQQGLPLSLRVPLPQGRGEIKVQ
jgi:hypothetical protein